MAKDTRNADGGGREAPASGSGGGAPRLLWPFKDTFYGWAIAATALVVSFASVPMYGPVLSIWFKPIQDDTGWSSAELSAAFTAGSFAGSILTYVAGRIMDRSGARAVTAVSGMLVASAMLGLAVMQAPWQMWIFFGAGRGIVLAGVQLGTTVSIANWFVRKRGRATSLAGFGLRFGQALVPLAVVPLILAVGWRGAYLAAAVGVLVLVCIPAVLFIRRRPEDYGLLPDGAKPGEHSAASTRGLAAQQAAVDAQTWTVAEARRTRAFWLILFAVSIVFFAQTATNLHAVPHFRELGVPFVSSAFIVFSFAMTSALTTFLWGWVLDRLHVRFVLMLVAGVYLGSMAVIVNATSMAGAIAFGLTFGLAQGGWTVAQRVVVPNYFGRRSVGAIRGYMGLFTAFINPVGPIAAGIIRDATGSYELAFIIFGGFFIAAALMMLLATPPRHPETI